MKKTLLIFMALAMSFFVIAQEKTKQKEVGLLFNDFDNFGLTFKTGTNNSLWRLNSLIISGNSQDEISDSSEYSQNRLGCSFKLGKEYRKAINENLELRYGADISFSYNQYEYDRNDKTVSDNDRYIKQIEYEPGINLVFGFNYLINNKIILGAELLPSFSYMFGTETDKGYYNDDKTIKSDISGFRYGLSNTSAYLSLAYRF
ncbi:MAG: hypothetical protein KAT68_05090 [Bacteroidales bacterium]|nr:hypothetical protein [Bacteroidales bacterium]